MLQLQKRAKLYLSSTGLYDIPPDWHSEKIGALIEDLKAGFASGIRDENGIFQLRMNNISSDGRLVFDDVLKVPVHSDIENFRLQLDDLIFNNTNSLDLIGKTAIVRETLPYTYSNHLTRIRVNKNKIIPSWLFYILLRYRERSVFRSICNTHVGQSGIGKNELQNLPIFFPSVIEQQRITSILTKVDELTQKTNQIIEQTQRLKKGLMQKLLTEGIGHTKFKKTDIGKIPVDWQLVKLEDLSTKITDGTHFTPHYTIDGIPFLRITDIQDEYIDWRTVKRISLSEHKELIKRCRPEKGDVLLSKNGTIGITKLVDWDTTFSIFVSICLIKPIHNMIKNKFLTYILSSDLCLRQIYLRSKQATVTNLHLEEIRELLIPLPPMPEQEKIDSILSIQDRSIAKQKIRRISVFKLKNGLMQNLLTGKIRVKI